jgi:co-chaperonin GroES (HSP10)
MKKLTPLGSDELKQVIDRITPLSNNVILRKIHPEENKLGMFVVASNHVAKTTLAEVLIPPKFSYHPNGDLRESPLRFGMRVRLPVGEIGTAMPEAPEGEEWIAMPDDCLYYITK